MKMAKATDAERHAIASGHPIAVEVWGTTHPPMYVGVGHPQALDLLRESGCPHARN